MALCFSEYYLHIYFAEYLSAEGRTGIGTSESITSFIQLSLEARKPPSFTSQAAQKQLLLMAWCTKNPCWLLELGCLCSQAMDRPRNHQTQNNCRSKLRLKQTPAPPRVMHHAHSCQHFGFGLASWLFLRVRKKSWSPTVSFCPKPILALADTAQTADSKQIPQPEAFNKVPVTFLRAVQQW